MSRATYVLAGTTVLGFLTSLWLYLDRESLRDEVAEKTAEIERATAPASSDDGDVWLDAKKPRDGKIAFSAATPQPSLSPEKREHRLDRRVRRTEEFAAMFGRAEGETEEQWRERIRPLIEAGLMSRRNRTIDNRRIAEEKARVTPEQSKKIDQAMEKIYDDLLSYTNKAIQDGQLSPYERNVAGWLDYAGGLGSILHDAEAQVGKILDPQQMRMMYESGFEWGEYLGFNAPWEKVSAPPTRKN